MCVSIYIYIYACVHCNKLFIQIKCRFCVQMILYLFTKAIGLVSVFFFIIDSFQR